MKIVIQIFCLPYEIDELENTLNQLRRASKYIDKSLDWYVDVCMCTADDMVNWSKSSIPKKYFEEKLLKLSSHTDWCSKNFHVSSEIKGCVSHRRYCLKEYEHTQYFIWLDTDIIFDERTLSYFQNAMQPVWDITPYGIITSELVRIWDNTWDCLVNENFINKKLGYQQLANPYLDSGIKGDISIEKVENSLSPQTRFKFAGGWFTCISGRLLREIGIPESFGHYGFEDTFVMMASEKLVKTKGKDIQQFKLKNLVVCENYKYRNNSHYLNNISVYDRREHFKQIAESNFMKELEKIN
jgi:hypothetical protein